MSLHRSAFKYLKPTDEQMTQMTYVRNAFADFAGMLDTWIPEGPDKTYILRKFREVGMWVNIAITRQPDGAPRE